MVKMITICRGDEYRAKIEKEITNETFFRDVYFNAAVIVDEIIGEMTAFFRENRLDDQRQKRHFLGMGNNIILFCGERGQGKTSAMRSFAAALDRKVEIREDTGIKLPDKKFVVLDSIDPTVLENGESIIKVVIARLFSEFEHYWTNANDADEKRKQLQMKKEDLLDLFRKCFLNIEYLKGIKQESQNAEELEYLAQMGNSAKLKENLFELVRQFMLLLQELGKKDFKPDDTYLVISVDDADLCTQNVFSICEDIRNYLSIPNVIVLMAADYQQLQEEIYKRYIKQDCILLEVEKKESVADERQEMAARYMEKIFPKGRNVELPEVADYLFDGEKENLKFRYIYRGQGVNCHSTELDDCLPEEVGVADNIQQQLLYWIYSMTNIVFCADGTEKHPFLPETMRELTHMVKILSDMKDEKDGTSLKQANVRDNISILKSYFLNYWCANHLSRDQRDTMQKMDKICSQHDKNKILKFLVKSKLVDDKKKQTGIWQILSQIRTTIASAEKDWKNAFDIYFTLFLNQWFAYAYGNKKKLAKFADCVGQMHGVSSDILENSKWKKKYNLTVYNMNQDSMIKYLAGMIRENPEYGKLLDCYCTLEGGEGQVSEYLLNHMGKNDPELIVRYDGLNAFLRILQIGGWENISHWETVGDESEETAQDAKQYLDYMRVLLANADLQKIIDDRITLIFKFRNSHITYGQIIRDLYKTLYRFDEVRYAGDTVRIVDYVSQEGTDLFFDAVFLCNLENQQGYLDEFKDYVLKGIKRMEKKTQTLLTYSDMMQVTDEWTAPVFTEDDRCNIWRISDAILNRNKYGKNLIAIEKEILKEYYEMKNKLDLLLIEQPDLKKKLEKEAEDNIKQYAEQLNKKILAWKGRVETKETELKKELKTNGRKQNRS